MTTTKRRTELRELAKNVVIEGWGKSAAELKAEHRKSATGKATKKRKTKTITGKATMKRKTKTIDDQLRSAIVKSGKTHYRLAKDTGVAATVIDRFMTRERDVRMVTAAKLATELGLQLR